MDADLGVALEQIRGRIELSEERILSAVEQAMTASAESNRTIKSLIVLTRWLVLALVAMASPEAFKLVLAVLGR